MENQIITEEENSPIITNRTITCPFYHQPTNISIGFSLPNDNIVIKRIPCQNCNELIEISIS
ncbi:hypothetical protein GW796_10055 [archaeon]|nr:hypothetical protein [archaeon]